MRRFTPFLIAGLALCGCGGDSSGTAAKPTATARAAELSEDDLFAVHDELYECLRKGQNGVLASYLNGQASVSDTYGNAEFDARLAAPDAEKRLLDAGKAQFIGMRADTRRKQRGPDWDVLIFPSSDAATGTMAVLRKEARSAEQDGIFVRVTRRDGSEKAARSAKRALSECRQRARPG